MLTLPAHSPFVTVTVPHVKYEGPVDYLEQQHACQRLHTKVQEAELCTSYTASRSMSFSALSPVSFLQELLCEQ